MKTIKLNDGTFCRHNHSDRMVKLAYKYLTEYFSDNCARRPGDFEDDFCGKWSFDQGPWRASPFYPALALLVSEGSVMYRVDEGTGDFWYGTEKAIKDQFLEQ